MTMKTEVKTPFVAYCRQALMVLLVNIPTISFGLATGWVSMASGSAKSEDTVQIVAAAGSTFVAALFGVPIAALALASGRRVAVAYTSIAMIACWSFKLHGEIWSMWAARVAAGLGGSSAWTVSPLLATEMCSPRVRGAAVSALVLAYNLGMLLIYAAAAAHIPHKTTLWWALGISVVPLLVLPFVPESPSYLAATGNLEKATKSLAWLRGRDTDNVDVQDELATLPPQQDSLRALWPMLKGLMSDKGRRKAFWFSLIAVVGQESCGVLALLEFAELVFASSGTEVDPAQLALLLGAVQLAASAVSLALVERVGRKPLIVGCGTVSALALGAAAWASHVGPAAAGLALAVAVAADSLGLQPAPYAMLAEMFHYEYRGCVLLVVTCVACVGNAFETVAFPGIASVAGVSGALGAAAVFTGLYSLWALVIMPETRNREPEEIYLELQKKKIKKDKDGVVCKETIVTNL